MKIAVTGGAGFLGYHIAREASARGMGVRLLDIAPYEPGDYAPSVECVTADVRDAKGLEKVFEGVDAVVHAAAALPLWKPQQIQDINVTGTRNVLEAARHNKIDRTVYISSTAVYGVPKVHPLDETAPLQGVGPYGESKIEAEKVCEEFRREGACVPILRPKTFIGSGRLGVFQILFEWVQEGKRIPVIGNGNNRYQLMEVRDFVDAILLAVASPADRANDTFNVGAKRFGTVSEDMTALCRYAGSGARVMATPAPLVKVVLRLLERFHLTPLYKWVYETADKDSFVSTQKIEERLGWSPKYSNAEALIEAYAWYQEHASELKGASGITHRVAWDQGALKFFKRWL